MVITISGTPGAGKTTVAKMLANKLQYEYYGVGQKLREQQGTPHVKKGDDNALDNYSVINETVVDGRLAYHFFPDSFKVYLFCSDSIAAQRIMQDNRKSEQVSDKELAIKKMKERKEYDKKRYMEEYGLDYTNTTQYDLVINTTKKSVDEIVTVIHKTFNKMLV